MPILWKWNDGSYENNRGQYKYSINKKPLSYERLKKIMGEPDKTEDNTDEIVGKYKSLIYDWRFGHDYIIFSCSEGIINSAFWYYAGD